MELFSGPYRRSDGLTACLQKQFNWNVTQIDNDEDTGGGHEHDLFNDETFARLKQQAAAGW